jgi:hypothetical protein
MKGVSSLGQGHAPTSSIEDEITFIESDEGNERLHSDSHKSDESFDGHSSVVARGLHTRGRSGYGNNTNVPSLRHCSWKGTECDVKDVEGVFVVN